MNKTLFLWILCLLWVSCKKKNETINQEDSKAINTISVIIDEQLWNSEVGDSIRNKFASPVLGLPQEEPLFSLKQYPAKLFEGYSTGSRNMIVVKKGTFNRYEMRVNEYSAPQNIIHITGKSTEEILFLLEKHYHQMIKKMHDTEILEYQKIISDSLIDTKKMKKKFNSTMSIPLGYEIVLSKRKLIWYKKEITSGNISILMYQIPYHAIHASKAVSDIVRTRDSIGKLYIKTRGSLTRMITDDAYSPYYSKTDIGGKIAFETKGTWQMKNDYMSGPFINYAIKDKKNNRILVLEGFCYAPSKEKRDLMFETEAIIKTLKILK